ncbi:MAG: hypothetical protein PHD57_13815 [Desulfobacterales bacterium]|jgi:hypothetical protein|nr:hypothetical protein [Desulfobacterales bacterium]MDD3082770.1 hypothetical protein [Desulfobacterales bacterium]
MKIIISNADELLDCCERLQAMGKVISELAHAEGSVGEVYPGAIIRDYAESLTETLTQYFPALMNMFIEDAKGVKEKEQ